MYLSKYRYGYWREGIAPVSSTQTAKAIRFVIVGDMHKNYPNTSSTDIVGVDKRTDPPVQPANFTERFNLLLNHLNKEKEQYGLNFVVFNGDLIHSTYEDKVPPLQEIKESINSHVQVPCYAVYGNHDRATDDQWQRVFGHTRNHFFSFGDFGFIILNTSDTDGNRGVCRGKDFLANALCVLAEKTGIFVFAHIPRYSGNRSDEQYDSPQCQEILDLFAKYRNIIAVIHSHFHEEDRTFKKNGTHYWFTGHFAQYGLDYYGYRVIEIDSCYQVFTGIYDVTNGRYRYL